MNLSERNKDKLSLAIIGILLSYHLIFNLGLTMPISIAITQGNSMQPTIEPCSITLLHNDDLEDIETGEIVGRTAEDGTDRLLLHRVTENTGSGYVTQGDNEQQIDMGMLDNQNEYIGSLLWHSPPLC